MSDYVYKVEYAGFLQTVARYFLTRERAEQWAMQVGHARKAVISRVRRVRGDA